MGQDKTQLLGQPGNIVGPRTAKYVTEVVSSVQDWNVISQMVLTQGDETLCNGDSGSAMIDLNDPFAPRTVRGTVQYGDAQCRATNTWNRWDTPEFDTWARSVAPLIACEADPSVC